MTPAVGVRLSDDILRKVESLGKSEAEDRSTIIRKAVNLGLKVLLEKKAAEEYTRGRITLSEAAHRADMTLWEMEKYLVDNGFRSSYSVEDLNKELLLLK